MAKLPSKALADPLDTERYQFLRQKSLPVTMKKLVPQIPAVAFIYSEDQLSVFEVFETTNLARCVNSDGKVNITRVLVHDTTARIGWIECKDTESRKNLYQTLSSRFARVKRLQPNKTKSNTADLSVSAG